MAEISYIEQNGQQVNLKDAKGRELLETKQNKLIAGNGISISEDGTISRTDVAAAPEWTRVKVEDYRIGSYASYTDTGFDIEFEYFGNPDLINRDLHVVGESYSGTSSFDNIYGNVGIVGYEPSINGAILEGLRDLPDNGLSYLFIRPIGAEVVYVEEPTEGVYQTSSVGDTSTLSFKLIYIEDNGSIAILNRGWTESNDNHYWSSSWDFGDTNTGDYISNPGNESLYLLMVRKLLGVHYEEISHD